MMCARTPRHARFWLRERRRCWTGGGRRSRGRGGSEACLRPPARSGGTPGRVAATMEWWEQPPWSGGRVAAVAAEKASKGQRCSGGAHSGRCEMGNGVSLCFFLRESVCRSRLWAGPQAQLATSRWTDMGRMP